MKRREASINGIFLALLFLLGLLGWTSELTAQAPFYQGKTITIVVGFAPGGAVDL